MLGFEIEVTGSEIGAKAGDPIRTVGRDLGDECICDAFNAGDTEAAETFR